MKEHIRRKTRSAVHKGQVCGSVVSTLSESSKYALDSRSRQVFVVVALFCLFVCCLFACFCCCCCCFKKLLLLCVCCSCVCAVGGQRLRTLVSVCLHVAHIKCPKTPSNKTPDRTPRVHTAHAEGSYTHVVHVRVVWLQKHPNNPVCIK